MQINNTLFENKFYAEAKEALGQVSDGSIVYKVIDLIDQLEDKEKLYGKAKQKLVNEYGTVNEDKQSFTIPKDKIELFSSELEKLLNEAVELRGEIIIIPQGKVTLNANQIRAIRQIVTISEIPAGGGS